MTKKVIAILENLDQKTFDEIMEVDKKLKDLRHEISEKLIKEEEHPDEYLSSLRRLADEVDRAIESLHHMMDIEISDQDDAPDI